MDEQRRNIDDVFRQSLSDYREAPPGAVWQKIASRLDEEDGRRRGFFFRRPWIVLSLLLLAGSAWVVVGLNRHDAGKMSVSAAGSNSNNNIASRQIAIQTNQRPVAATSSDAVMGKDETILAKMNVDNETPPPPTAPVTPVALNAPISAQNVVVPRLSPKASSLTARVSPLRPSAPSLAAAVPIAPAIEAPEKAHVEKLGIVKHSPGSSPEAVTQMPAPATLAGDRLALATQVAKPEEAKEALPLPAPLAAQEAALLAVPEIATPVPAKNWIKPAEERVEHLANIGTPPLQEVSSSPAPDVAYASILPAAVIPRAEAAAKADDLPEQIVPKSAEKPFIAAGPQNVSEEPVVVVNDAAAQKKPEVADQTIQSLQTEAPKPLNAAYKMPLSLAVLAGYEHAFSTPSLERYTASMRLLWQVNRTIAIGLQPAFRFGNLSSVSLGSDVVYQRSFIQVDSFHTGDNSPTVRGAIDSIYNYVVREQFDSMIVRGGTAGGGFWEVELPIIMQYKVSSKWHVYGGPSLNFGGRISSNGAGEVQVSTINRRDSIAQSQPLPAAAFNNYFGRSSLSPYSSYKPADAPQNPPGVRLGYVAGIGYSRKRLMIDASVHQQLSGYNVAAEPLRKVYASPQLRLSIGYLLFEPKAGHKGVSE